MTNAFEALKQSLVETLNDILRSILVSAHVPTDSLQRASGLIRCASGLDRVVTRNRRIHATNVVLSLYLTVAVTSANLRYLVKLRELLGNIRQYAAARIVASLGSIAFVIVVESRSKVSNLARSRICKVKQAVLHSLACSRTLIVKEGSEVA